MMSRVLGSDVEVDPAEVRESFGAELGTWAAVGGGSAGVSE